MSVFLHVDMDAFFASIEQAVNPRLKGKPLVVGSRGKRMHTVVCAASYAAKALGIHSGMSSREAFLICPNLEFVKADQAKYIWTSERILEILQGYGFPLSYASIDEFQMELFGKVNPLDLGRIIKERIYADFNITASVGIAESRILAKLASKLDKPDGLSLIDASNFKDVLSRTCLDELPGMGGKTGAGLIKTGLKTCWDLYLNLPGFFKEDDKNPGKSDEGPKSVGHSYTLPDARTNPQVILAWIRLLSEMVSSRLRRQGLAGFTVAVRLAGPLIGDFCLQKTYKTPTNDGYEIYKRAVQISSKIASKTPRIRLIGITCSGLSFNAYLNPLFKEDARREGLLRALDSINNRYGDGSIYPAVTALAR
ncbi:MAG: hypothetical protein WC066_05755 [Candidatus Omnitrophota bacterium]